MEAGAHGVDLVVELGTRVGSGAAGQHLAESVGDTGGGEGIVTGTGTNVNSNGGSGGQGLLSGNADAVSEGGELEGAVVLEGLGDLATGQVAKVQASGSLRELHEAALVSNLVGIGGVSFDKIIGAVIVAAEAPGSSDDRSFGERGGFLNALRDL
jgi:hypothetical protein